MLMQTSSSVADHKHTATCPAGVTHVPPRYVPAVDGLRALAVLLVMFCHAKWTLFSGGYIGVDVFFVISGFVVTQSIRKDQTASGFSLAAFYARRLKRLAPALYLVSVATLGFGFMFCAPNTNYDIIKNIGFLSLFSANIYLAKKTGYFDPSSENQPLLHTWSLSVEEQFYLALPILLIASMRIKGNTRFALFALLAIAGLAFSHYAVSHGQSNIYFFAHTRAYEFLIGVVLALLLEKTNGLASRFSDVAAAVGLTLIIWSAVTFTAATSMPGINALWPCLGAVAIIAGKDAPFVGRLLTNRVAVYLGQLSYVPYLWHWPLLFAMRRFNLSTHIWTAAALLIALALAIPTHHFLESPIRRLRWSLKRTYLTLAAAPILILGSIVIAAKQTDSFAALYSAEAQNVYAATGHWVFNTDRDGKCFGKSELTSGNTCGVGDLKAATKAILLGDSHAYQLIEFMDSLGKEYSLAIHDFTQPKCPPVQSTPTKAMKPASQPFLDRCTAHNRAAFDHVLSDKTTSIVFIAAYWRMYGNEAVGDHVSPSDLGYMPHQLDRAMEVTIRKLLDAGKRVILLDDVPTPPAAITNCLIDQVYLNRKPRSLCTYPQSLVAELDRTPAAMLSGLVKAFPAISIIHTYDVPCNADTCQTQIDGVPLYKDGDPHLGLGGSRLYYRAYRAKHPAELDRLLKAEYAPRQTL